MIDPSDPRLRYLQMLQAQAVEQAHAQVPQGGLPAPGAGAGLQDTGGVPPAPGYRLHDPAEQGVPSLPHLFAAHGAGGGVAVPDAGWAPQGQQSFPLPSAPAPAPLLPEDNGLAGMAGGAPSIAALLAQAGSRRPFPRGAGQRAFPWTHRP